MAVKAEISIRIYKGGIRTYAARRTVMANSIAAVMGRLLEEARAEYPDFERATASGQLDSRTRGSIVHQYEDGPALIRLEADILSNPNRT